MEMSCTGGSLIASVLEHLRLEDVQVLLENSGIPSIGDKEELTDLLKLHISLYSNSVMSWCCDYRVDYMC